MSAHDVSAEPRVSPDDTPAPDIRGGIEWFTISGEREEDCQCARCGSSCAWVDCGNCGGDDEALGSDCIDDLCHGGECIHGDSGFILCDWCGARGGSYHCLSGPEWCEANPLPDRAHITSTAMRSDAWND